MGGGRAAFAALRTLGGVQIPYEARRWRWWWRERSHRATEQLPPALASLEAPDGSSELALRMIADLGWVDLPATRELLATWLQGGTTAQAAAAAHLVGSLRLADLADEVGFALEVRTGAALRAAAEATLRQLGVPLA